MFEGLLGLILLALVIYGLVKTWSSPAALATKVIWSVVLIMLPVVGFIAWLLIGPRGPDPSYA